MINRTDTFFSSSHAIPESLVRIIATSVIVGHDHRLAETILVRGISSRKAMYDGDWRWPDMRSTSDVM
ncbi:MAG TPA: hypothetical protein DDZ51_15305 [Planctomycetaceae bacterium]|nr:hypothetical protein [Planctomycetaceae bacterium]